MNNVKMLIISLAGFSLASLGQFVNISEVAADGSRGPNTVAASEEVYEIKANKDTAIYASEGDDGKKPFVKFMDIKEGDKTKARCKFTAESPNAGQWYLVPDSYFVKEADFTAATPIPDCPKA